MIWAPARWLTPVSSRPASGTTCPNLSHPVSSVEPRRTSSPPIPSATHTRSTTWIGRERTGRILDLQRLLKDSSWSVVSNQPEHFSYRIFSTIHWTVPGKEKRGGKRGGPLPAPRPGGGAPPGTPEARARSGAAREKPVHTQKRL